MKRAIIDGATSFIGIALLQELRAKGYELYLIIRPDSVRRPIIELYKDEYVHIVECHFSEYNLLAEKVSCYFANKEITIDEFYHIGWSTDFCDTKKNLKGHMMNVEYACNALYCAAKLGCDSFVVVGSQAECGLVTEPICSKTKDNPCTPYGEAKCETYRKCCDIGRDIGVHIYWSRLLSAYGPYDKQSTLVMQCINACKRKESIDITKGDKIWDYVYVADVARALYSICDKGIEKKKYTIASGKPKILKEYIEDIAKVYDNPNLLNGIGKRPYSKGEVMYLVGDISELYEDTGMVIDSVFIDCIRNSINW
ncbi:MAG: NAD-dependent epimerase/dehydratase family protein [Lachnospiraceae bacterium]|nr:NAD-dependent epimerase/dehydratase family protein [Lachnospiraceae bacterium]